MSGFDLSRVEAENMIVQARLAVGWITEEDLAANAPLKKRRLKSDQDADSRRRGQHRSPATDDDTGTRCFRSREHASAKRSRRRR